jgi:hypothetical protein
MFVKYLALDVIAMLIYIFGRSFCVFQMSHLESRAFYPQSNFYIKESDKLPYTYISEVALWLSLWHNPQFCIYFYLCYILYGCLFMCLSHQNLQVCYRI